MDSVQVEQEAMKFLLPGYFRGDFADTMVLLIANAIDTSFIVLSSIPCQAVIVITPRTCVTQLYTSNAGITQFGAGHSDAVFANIRDPHTPVHFCRCRNDDKVE